MDSFSFVNEENSCHCRKRRKPKQCQDNSMINLERPILIGGPCAAESAEQVNKTAFDARVRGFGIFRASLEKPRTSPWEIVNGERRPCFLGVGVETGAPWLVEASKRNNIVPATEVMSGGQLLTYLEVASGAGLKNVCALLGSRRITDQNFLQEIGGIARENPTLILGLKNPTAKDERTWLGVIGWTILGGADPRQMFTVHRGFPDDSQKLFRNPPPLDLTSPLLRSSFPHPAGCRRGFGFH